MSVIEGIDDFSQKRLFICCDGTWQNAASNIHQTTNVARFARCVHRLELNGCDSNPNQKDHVVQVVWYSGGVGTYASLMTEWIWSGLTGAGVTSTILNAYYFLSSNYNFAHRKDEIILVGYSRGAFALRCLAAFISEVGLLRRVALPHLRSLFQLWIDEKEELKKMKAHLLGKDPPELDQLVKITVLAEFDPVSAILDPFQWPRNKPKRIASMVDQLEVPAKVNHAFLAMALNEKRSEFKPMLWKRKNRKDQVVRQCAFLGCHGDIGGGNADSGLSQLPLLWMIAQVQRETSDKREEIERCGAQFDEDQLLQFASPSTVGYPRGDEDIYTFETFSSTIGKTTESFTFPWKVYHIFKNTFNLGNWKGGQERASAIEAKTRLPKRRPDEVDQDGSESDEEAIQKCPDDDSEDETLLNTSEEDGYKCPLKIHFSVYLLYEKRPESGEGENRYKTFTYELGALGGYKHCIDPRKQRPFHYWERPSTNTNGVEYLRQQYIHREEDYLLREWTVRAQRCWNPEDVAEHAAEHAAEIARGRNLITKWKSSKREFDKLQTLAYFFWWTFHNTTDMPEFDEEFGRRRRQQQRQAKTPGGGNLRGNFRTIRETIQNTEM